MDKPLLYMLVCLILHSCNSEEEQSIADIELVESHTDLAIGLPDQSLEYQFGEPVAVRTDQEGLIYVADRGSMEVKVFDSDGQYIKSIGGRGRGPGEIHEIELMEMTPEDNIVILDRVNLRFMTIDRDGEQVDMYPYNLENQFYPQSVAWLDNDEIMALFLNPSSTASNEIPELERDLFHIYSTDFQDQRTSFMPMKNFQLEEWFLFKAMAFHPGSITLSPDKKYLYYSPTNYSGSLYRFHRSDDGAWKFDELISGVIPDIEPYRVYDSNAQYDRIKDGGDARVNQIHDSFGVHMGSLYIIDAGLYTLKDGRLIHFYAQWEEEYTPLPESSSHQMDLYMQVFDADGKLQRHGYLFPFIERSHITFHAAVNWMGSDGEFYLLDQPDGIPIVRRFHLNL